MNSHGGNMAILKTVVDEIAVKSKVSILYFTYWKLLAEKIGDLENRD
jgi:creatinine amidohydrolase/Fe(II)-dependent formamide hydrolase-like protein